ncbi:MAG: hypothetical protein SGI90_16195, partial [Candidatus Eisenbacteria bacterium]|nr:hypothetical protein [Candidatus Eisenbacteria bacterium]
MTKSRQVSGRRVVRSTWTLLLILLASANSSGAGDITSGGGTRGRLDIVLTDRLGPWVGGHSVRAVPGLALDVGLLSVHSQATPVAWLSFSAAALVDGVHLEWTVTTNSDPVGFLIERATGPGGNRRRQLTPPGDLETYVRLTPDPLPGLARQFLDVSPPNATEASYRLVGIDRAGRSFVSEAIHVALDPGPMSFVVGPPRPNPTVAGTTLAVSLATAGPVRLRVFDAAGRLVAE